MSSGQVRIIPNGVFSERDLMETAKLNLVNNPTLLIEENAITFRELAGNIVEGNVKSLSGSTPAWVLSTNREDQLAAITLTANATLSMTGLVDGMSGLLIVTQDGTGGWTLTLPVGSKIVGGSYTPTAAAGAIDLLHWWYQDELLWKATQNYT